MKIKYELFAILGFLLFNFSSLANNGQNPLENIPSELILKISEYLNLSDTKSFLITHKKVRQSSGMPWKNKFREILGALKDDDPKYYFDNEDKTNENIDWKSTFIQTLMKVEENNKAYVLKNKNIPNTGDKKRDKLLMFADLRNAEFSNTNISYGNFFNANLQGIKLDNTNLVLSNFNKANLSNAIIKFSSLASSTFNGADLTRAQIQFSSLAQAKLIGANLTGVNLLGTNVASANFKDAFIMENGEKKSVTIEILKGMGIRQDYGDFAPKF